MLASPAGIETTSQFSTHISSAEHTAITSGQHLSLISGDSLLAVSLQAIKLFAAQQGIDIIAAHADIQVKALEASMHLLARDEIVLKADKITIEAKSELNLNGGGSYAQYQGGSIETGTTGSDVRHARNHGMSGPSSRGNPSLPMGYRPGKGQLELTHRYAAKRQGLKGAGYEVVDLLGQVKTGTLDEEGFAAVSGLTAGGVRIKLDKDPRNAWDEASHFGEPDWPNGPLSDGKRTDVGAMPPLIPPPDISTAEGLARKLDRAGRSGELDVEGLLQGGRPIRVPGETYLEPSDPKSAQAADEQRRHQANTIGLLAGGVLGVPGFAARGWGAPEPVVEAITEATTAVGLVGVSGGFKSRIIEPASVPPRWEGNAEHALVLRDFAAKVEQGVTPALQATAEAAGGRMVGLDARLKTADSLTRKLNDFPTRPINDALRYTMIFDEATFASGVRGTPDQMAQRGHELVRMRNTFKASVPYKGINSTYRTLEGQEFELQFHTPESFDMKENVNHVVYEQQRVLDQANPDWKKLDDQMISNSDTIAVPDGAAQIKGPKKRR